MVGNSFNGQETVGLTVMKFGMRMNVIVQILPLVCVTTPNRKLPNLGICAFFRNFFVLLLEISDFL